MASISDRFPPIIVEYDCRGIRKQRHFKKPHGAKSFYMAKDRECKNPKIINPYRKRPKSTNRVACYLRVSTIGQNEAGQRLEIERWLKGNGIENAVWFVDKASGDNLDRPEFQRLQTAVFNGEIKTVVVWKLDRLSRSIQDGINVLADWCDKGLRVVSVTQQIDFNGTIGKMLAAVLLGVAEMEQETRRERQAAGIEAAKERGVYKGRKIGTTKAAPQRAMNLKAIGLSNVEIANVLGVSRMTVSRYLKFLG